MRERQYDTPAERLKAWRERQRNVSPETIETFQSETIERNVTHTPTDALFEAAKPGYYIFDGEVKERSCWRCGEAYTTRLDLNKFCSPACKHMYLKEAFHVKH